ncbi:MAG: FAD-dependent oxidoreductase [Albidovulum sp.]|nr:FAD-dependent oxidoreductase [Albidovulum sp.]
MAIKFTWNGETLDAEVGDSIAAALAANGILALGASRTGRKRGVFCGMGLCYECLVAIDGAGTERACIAEVCEGMVVRSHRDFESACRQNPGNISPRPEANCDVAIVGSGPAGLTAGVALDSLGLSVCVFDERKQMGGQYYKPRSDGFRGTDSADRQHLEGDALRNRARYSNIEFWLGATVWCARRGNGSDSDRFIVKAFRNGGTVTVKARALAISTGAVETSAAVPGWTLPGAMTIGAAQTLARRYGVLPGKKILVASNGPLGLQLAAELCSLGGEVVGLFERGRVDNALALSAAARHSPRLFAQGASYRLRLAMMGVKPRRGWEVSEIHGTESVERVTLLRIADGKRATVAADALCFGEGFASEHELARQLGVPVEICPETFRVFPSRRRDGDTPVEGVWIVGDAGGLKGAQAAEQQGELAARGIAMYLGKPVVLQRSIYRKLAQIDSFQKALWNLYEAPARKEFATDALICRCEEVTFGEVSASIEKGARDLGSIKRATRLGMGRCQGRYCASPALRMLHESGAEIGPESLPAPQLPAKPVSISSVAVEKPEWRGHARSVLTTRPRPKNSCPIRRPRADLAIIGGGITGILTAYWASKAGAEVVCLERGLINGEASGGNAGSLHLQLLSWDFGADEISSAAPLRTLPSQKDGIDLWISLEQELARSFEIRMTGGLMVAENRDQVAFVEAKVKAETQIGIATEVVDAEFIREIAPAISKNVVAGAWCPGEGKINPLLASNALLDAARSNGAVFEEGTRVNGLDRSHSGYEIHTNRGDLNAEKVVVAAGGWCSEIGRMLGVELPISGAPIQIVVTEPAAKLVPCLVAHAGRHITMKQTESGNVLIGGAWTAGADEKGHQFVKLESLEGNLWVAEKIFPAAGHLSFIRCWGSMNIDIDGAPVISFLPGHPNVVVAAAANGYTMAPLIGREAARLALKGKARRDLECFNLDRFN